MFTADPVIPQEVIKPHLFDHTFEESAFFYDRKRQKNHSTTLAEAKSNHEAKIVLNKTAEDLQISPNTENTVDTSPFYTLASEKQTSRSHTPRYSPKSFQNEQSIAELPTTSDIPVSNLAKLLKEKRHERDLAKQRTTNTVPTVQTRLPQKPTSSSSQVAQNSLAL